MQLPARLEPGATLRRLLALAWLGLLVLLLVGCAATPRVPDWQLEAHGAQQRAIRADLEGRQRAAAAEWQRALEATRRTARADWLARIELSRCALQQAALDLQPCHAAQALLPYAGPAEQAYARYLQAQPQPDDLPLLPAAHRGLARQLLQPAAATEASALLRAIDEPLARLVAASVLLRAQRLDLPALTLALDSASEQGWRRPLLAWLLLQQQWAQQVGQTELAAQARQRADWLIRPGAP